MDTATLDRGSLSLRAGFWGLLHSLMTVSLPVITDSWLPRCWFPSSNKVLCSFTAGLSLPGGRCSGTSCVTMQMAGCRCEGHFLGIGSCCKEQQSQVPPRTTRLLTTSCYTRHPYARLWAVRASFLLIRLRTAADGAGGGAVG